MSSNTSSHFRRNDPDLEHVDVIVPPRGAIRFGGETNVRSRGCLRFAGRGHSLQGSGRTTQIAAGVEDVALTARYSRSSSGTNSEVRAPEDVGSPPTC